MKRSLFPLFSSSLECAHHYWKQLVQPGNWAIDATCGNGRDTLLLATILKELGGGFGVISIDIQETALHNAKLLTAQSPSLVPHIHFFLQSHEQFPSLAYEHPISLIVYNLGYLPGGDKKKTTFTSTTIASLLQAKDLLAPGGAISITCYPGHEEGKKEEESLVRLLSQFPQNQWHITHHLAVNRELAPSLLLLQKTIA